LEIPTALGTAPLRCVPKIETPAASQQIPSIVKLANPFVAPMADEPWTVATEIAWTPTKPNSLGCAASKLYIDPPSIGRQLNQPCPSEADHGVRNQRLSERAHAVQDVHVEGSKMLNCHASGHHEPILLEVMYQCPLLRVTLIRVTFCPGGGRVPF
jgi:hypothetical protein